MARAYHAWETDGTLARRYSGPLLLLATAGLLNACGSGGGGGDGVLAAGCTTGPASAVLTWDAVTAANGYRIYYGTAPGTYPQGVDVGQVTTYTVTGLASGTTYYFVATDYDSSNSESAYSNAVCKTIS